MKADGTIWIDTKIDESGMEDGFNRLRDGADDVAVSVRKAGESIESSFSKINVSKAIANAEAQIKNLQQKLDAISSEYAAALSEGDDKAAERLAQKRTAIYDRLEHARERLAIEVAAAADKEATAEEKASERAIRAAEKEAAAKRKALGKQFDDLGRPARRFRNRLREIVAGAFVFNVISAGLRSVTSYFGEALMANNEFASAVSQLRGSLMVAFQPILEYVTPVLIQLIQWLNVAVQAVARFFATLTGKSYSQMKKNAQSLNKQAGAIENVGEAAREAEKYLAGFDEINRMMSKEDYPSTGSGNGSGINVPTFDDVEIPSEWETAIDNLAMRVKDIFFTWDNLNAEIITEKLLTALTMIAGGLIGFALGGPAGALIGMTVGAGLGVVLSSIIFDGDGTLSAKELEESLLAVLLIIGGAGIGFALGGPGGALLGATIGLGLTLALLKMDVAKSEGTISTEELIRGLISVLSFIGGAAVGFLLGGPGGAAIGAMIGLGISFAVLGTSFQAVESEYNSLNKKVGQWSRETTDTTNREYIEPTTNGFMALVRKIRDGIESSKDGILHNMDLAATGTDMTFFKPVAQWSAKLWENISKDNKTTSDRIIENMERAARQTETGYVIPTKEQFESTANWITEKFTSARDKIQGIWQAVPGWFQMNVTEPMYNFFNKLTEGLVEGFHATADSVNGAIEDLGDVFDRVVNNIASAIADMVAEFNSLAGKLSARRAKVYGSSEASATSAAAYPAYPVMDVPMLARGAVIPPNHKFLAVLGDQRSGTNVEAPLSTIQEAVAIVMEDMIQSNLAGHEATVAILQQILEAVLGIELDGETISRAMNNYNMKMAAAKGGLA